MTRLDAIQTLAQLDAFSATSFLDQLREELAPAATPTLASLDQSDASVRAVLDAIDRFTATSMRIRLDAALATDTTVPPTFRRTLTATVLQYERDLDTLRSRVASVAARTDPARADAAADAVVDAAARVLADREVLRAGLLDLARAIAAVHLPPARQAAWNRALDDAERARWAAQVAAMEQLLGVPAEDEPPPPEPPTRGELLEFD